MKKFALLGNPNCGKTTLFNSLTGSTAHVGNWPGVTVDKRDGVCKLGKEEIDIVDLPGIYSLSPYTPEEVISRNYIIDEKPDCVINIIDSTNFERNLYLTTQLMEMDVPIVVALNMMDILDKRGDSINEKELSLKIGLPVIKISALKENNLKKLIDLAIESSGTKREGTSVLESSPVGHLIKDLAITFHTLGVDSPLFHACKLAEFDELEKTNHSSLVHMVEHFREENVDPKFGNDYEALIADSRYKYITENFSPCLNKVTSKENENKSYKIDKVLTHKWFGIPIFIAILFVMFHLVFSTNFLFLGNLINTNCFEDIISKDSIWSSFIGLFYTTSGINSPGVILSNLVNGLTGAFNNQVAIWLSTASPWVKGLICDGILSGLFAVIGFLPQILLLFLLFSILEDSGYMARVAFILDRIFKKLGLSGRAFLPMIMGFGCSVPAMINTRTLANEKEKVATIRVIPFFSCGAKLPILTGIGGAIVSAFGFANVDLITLGIYVLGIVTALFALAFMKNTVLKNNDSAFIMELPNYRTPQFKSTMLLVWDKAKHFIKKAFTIILASTIVIWFVSHFKWNWTFTEEMDQSMLSNIGQFIQPIFVPLGFGIGTYGWVFVVAAISGLIAKENTIATLSTLAAVILSSKGVSFDVDKALEVFVSFSGTSVQALLAFIAFNLLTIPCVATVATAKAELPKKSFKWTILFWVLTSFIVSSMVFVIGSWWWTSFIFIALIILAFWIIYHVAGRPLPLSEK